jgi:N-acetylgalactosamine-6-sulfatase
MVPNARPRAPPSSRAVTSSASGGLECAIGTGNVGRYDDAIRLASQHDLGLPTSHVTIARLLQDTGYATALVGKWHLGHEDKFAPRGHGFAHAFYALGGGMDYFRHVEEPSATALTMLRLNGAPVQRDGYFTDLIADDAVRWLRETKQPFFLYVPFTAPHAPYQGPDFRSPAEPERWKQGSADPREYAAMIERMDKAIGRILDTLPADTLVIFTSDNGGTASARPTGLRGQKGSTFEGGIRVPCIVRWPGKLQPDTENSYPALTFDLTASIARAAGVQPPSGRLFEGVDILQRGPPPARVLCWRLRRGERTVRAVRDGPLKYVSRQEGDTFEEWLFDVALDPGEQHDLLPSRAADATRLKAKLAAWEEEVKPVR